VEITEREKMQRRPSLSVLALVSFMASFLVARIFTTFNPGVIVVSGSIHIHHFWFGLMLQAVGGWLGISYNDERVDRLAAILFGAGGGLIGDEVGLLLTFENYWSEITYTFIILLLAVASTSILLIRYSRAITTELTDFVRSNASLYFGVFLAVVSVAFIMETDNALIIAVSSVASVTACAAILAYLAQRIKRRRTKAKATLR
jgi:FtsH-binding integral membrane protein